MMAPDRHSPVDLKGPSTSSGSSVTKARRRDRVAAKLLATVEGGDERHQARMSCKGTLSPAMILGLILALGSALGTNLGFLFKHRGAVLAQTIRVRHPVRSR